MATFHFHTHVSDNGVITLPLHAEKLYGKDVVINVDLSPKKESKRTFEQLCGIWGKEEEREDVDRMVAAIHEGRLLGTEREAL